MTDLREARAAGLGLAILLVYMALVLASGRVAPADFAILLLNYLKGSLALTIFLGVGGLVWLLYVNRPRDGGEAPSPFAVAAAWARQRWARDRLVSVLWPPLLFATLMASFNAFKQMVLPLAGFRFDPLFAEVDRALFFGQDPWRVTHALIPAAGTGFIDAAYHGWFVPMALGVMICAWLPRDSFRLRTQYLLSYIAMWIGVGSILAFLLPAAGPCYYGHFVGPSPEFQALLDRLAADQAALGTPLSALNFQQGLLHVFGSDTLAVGGGISAMPSVHNGLAALFAFAAFRIHRAAGWAMALFAALIWIGSIHLGWHYAIDGIVSIALAWVIWRVAGRVTERLDRPQARLPAALPA